jgi:hypothetical protein
MKRGIAFFVDDQGEGNVRELAVWVEWELGSYIGGDQPLLSLAEASSLYSSQPIPFHRM